MGRAESGKGLFAQCSQHHVAIASRVAHGTSPLTPKKSVATVARQFNDGY